MRLLSVGLLVSIASGCSALVAGPPGSLHCEVVGTDDPCPPPYACIANVCVVAGDPCNLVDDDADGRVDEGSEIAGACSEGQRCVNGACLTGCSTEVCNGRDDDCDGMADQGLDIDGDTDGVSACPPGDTARPDCDDTNPAVHPANPATGVSAAMEICNGFDDDCDPTTTEDLVGICPGGACQRLPGAGAPMCFALDDCRITGCTSPQYCDANTNRCSDQPSDCRVSGMNCPSPLICNADGMCEAPPVGGIGAPCVLNSQCDSGLCMTRASLGLDGEGGLCGRACCRDDDCRSSGDGLRCWAPGTGARSCVTAEVYGDLTAVTCNTVNECPDGCLARTVTVTAPDGGESTFDGMFCDATDPVAFPYHCYDTILGRPGCLDGFCITSAGVGQDACAVPCERTQDCLDYYPRSFRDSDYTPVCGHVLTASSVFTACVPPPASGAGTGRTGDTCMGNSGCRDGLCVSNVCADVCCSDRNCESGERCLPVPVTLTSSSGTRDAWEMRCFRRTDGPM